MAKLKLDVSALSVESFDALPERERRVGTVHAAAGTVGCPADDTDGYETCGGPMTYCQPTCLCPNTSPLQSCDECSWMECQTLLEDC